MADKYYNGHLLPDIEPLWDKSKYPYACIAIMGNIATLLFTDKVGYIERETVSGYTIGSYTLGLTSNDAYDESKVIFARVYVVALNEAGVEQWADTYPGISTDAWVEKAWSDPMGTGIPTYGYYAISVQDGPQWSNHTLYDQNGNLVIEPSDPVAYFDLRAWLTGYALGLSGKPLPFSKVQKVPVAYLYNGVRLPKLPEWDREAYPYATISCFPSSKSYYTLRLFSTDAYYTVYGNNQWVFMGDPGGVLESVYWVDKEFVWPQLEVLSNGAFINMTTNPRVTWVDFDLLDRDGSVFLAASDPVPVYE